MSKLLAGWPTKWGLFLLLINLTARAQPVMPRLQPARLVNDLAGLLTAAQADSLEHQLATPPDSVSARILVVTVPSLGGCAIEEYARRLVEAWHVPQGIQFPRSIVLLVAAADRRLRIQTDGYGGIGSVSDAEALRIITTTLAPAFRAHAYYAGLRQAATQLLVLSSSHSSLLLPSR